LGGEVALVFSEDSIMNRVEKTVTLAFMKSVIHNHIKSYSKKGIQPTVEQVMNDIDKDKLITILNYLSEDEIKGAIEDTIRRQKCKG